MLYEYLLQNPDLIPWLSDEITKEIYIPTKELEKIDEWEIWHKQKDPENNLPLFKMAADRLKVYQQLIRVGYMSCLLHMSGELDVDFPDFSVIWGELLTKYDLDLLYEIYLYGK